MLGVNAVQSAFSDAVDLVRALLLSQSLTPAIFRAKLAEIPAQDRDAWLDRLWGVHEIPDDDPHLPRGCIPYLPCPVGTVLEALQQASVMHEDVFVDVGSGTGRAAVLAHLLTSAVCIGVEIQAALVQVARGRAVRLKLDQMRFVEGDAADLLRFITTGTVFFFYCPFADDRVQRILDALEAIARIHEIRICCVHMPPLERPWLAPLPSTSVDLHVYRSTLRDADPVSPTANSTHSAVGPPIFKISE